MSGRSSDKVLGDLLDACDAAAELVARGSEAFDSDQLLRLAAEAIIGRIGDSAAKLRQAYGESLPTRIPWDEVIGNRIVVDHAYHRVDYGALWVTLERDVPELREAMGKWNTDAGPHTA